MLVPVARAREVGVYPERLDADVSIGELAETVLSKPERRALERLDEESRQSTLLAFWTRKEALAKAEGSGLSMRLSDIDVSGPAGLIKNWEQTKGDWKQTTR